MYEIYKLLDVWYVKAIFAAATALFSPFKVSLLVLCTMIIIDTVTGSIYAINIKKFNSRGFRKGVNKLIIYFVSILVVRLVEVGIASIVNTTILTDFMTGYLILTECFSALENLTLLGAPLPGGLTKMIISHIKNETFKEILNDGIDKRNYIQEISDMMEYNFPGISDEKVRKMLEIGLKEWAKFINILDVELGEAENYGNDLLLYKVLALIDATVNKSCEKFSADDIPSDFVKKFNNLHKPKVDKFLVQVKEICDTNDSIEEKKGKIIEKLIILLYQTLTDVKKIST